MGPSSPVPVYSRQVILGRTDSLNETRQKKRVSEVQLRELTEAQKTMRNELGRQEKSLQTLKNSRQEKERQLEKKLTRQQIIETELVDLQNTASELADLIEALRTKAVREAEAVKALRMSKISSGQAPIPAKSLPWPVVGSILERFGRHKNVEFGTPYISNGIIIGLKSVQPVKAVAEGNVLYVGTFMSYGLIALLEHPGDWYTVYGHLSNIKVEKGQQIRAGELVGFSGIKNNASEAYFELRFYGKPTDPLPWLAD